MKHNVNNKKYDGVMIYPNPSNTAINIRLSTYSSNEFILITDVFGRIIYKELLQGINTKLDVSSWNNGVYFYEIMNGKEILRGKFIKEM